MSWIATRTTVLKTVALFSEWRVCDSPFATKHTYRRQASASLPINDKNHKVGGKAVADRRIRGRVSTPGFLTSFAPGTNCEVLLSKARRQLREHKTILDEVVNTFSSLDPSPMELVSTIHYVQSSYRQWCNDRPSKDQVVQSVVEIKKDKFSEDFVNRVYDILKQAALLS